MNDRDVLDMIDSIESQCKLMRVKIAVAETAETRVRKPKRGAEKPAGCGACADCDDRKCDAVPIDGDAATEPFAGVSKSPDMAQTYANDVLVLRVVRDAQQSGRQQLPMSVIVDSTDLSLFQARAAVRRLCDDGHLVKVGDKRGASYRLPNSAE